MNILDGIGVSKLSGNFHFEAIVTKVYLDILIKNRHNYEM